MSSPRLAGTTLVTVSSKTTPVILGTFAKGTQVINNSAGTDTVWIGNTNGITANTAIPLQAQASVTLSQNGPLYAILDPAAAAAVQLIVGGNIDTWAPSPVKTVNISGPVTIAQPVTVQGNVNVSGTVNVGTISGTVTVTGAVTVSGTVNVGTISGTVTVTGSVAISGGTVNIGTISGTVTINTANVNVINTPTVTPLPRYTTLLTNVTGQNLLPDLSPYSTLIVKAGLSNTGSLNLSAYGALIVQLAGAGGIILVQETFYMQGWHTNSGGAGTYSPGDSISIIIPTKGSRGTTGFMDTTLVNTGVGADITYSVIGVNVDLPFSVLSTVAATDWDLLNINVDLFGAANTNYTIPVTSAPCRIYSRMSSGAGVTGVTVTLTDMVTGLSVGVWTLVKGSALGQEVVYNGTALVPQNGDGQHIELPHTLNVMRLSYGSVAATAAISLIIVRSPTV